MGKIVCDSCGGNDFIESGGFRVCKYCGTKQIIFQETKVSAGNAGAGIAIDDDIQRLLEKCRKDPVNAKRYANLILDIDANNAEARKYL